MKKIICSAVVVLLATVLSYAQPDTGDTELNGWLTSIVNKYKAHGSDFRHYILTTYKVHPDKYDYLQTQGMTIGDIYLASEIAKVTKKQPDDVFPIYKRDKTKGWAVIAKESNVSASAFERLKDDAYQLANGAPRPKPKPKPATKSKQTTKTKQTTKPATKTAPKTKTTAKPSTPPSTKPKN